MGLPDLFKPSWNPKTVRKKTLDTWLQKSDLLSRLNRMKKKEGDIFLKVGSMLKHGTPSCKEKRTIVEKFKKKMERSRT